MIENTLKSRPSLEITRGETPSSPVLKTTKLLVPRRLNPLVINRSVERAISILNDNNGSWMDSDAEKLRRHLVHHIPISDPSELAYETSNPANYLLREEEDREFLYIFELDNPGAVVGHTLIHQDKWVSKMFADLVAEENKLSSGKVAKKTFGPRSFAMVDRLREGRETITAADPFGRLVNTLYTHRYIPVGNDGRVILPART